MANEVKVKPITAWAIVDFRGNVLPSYIGIERDIAIKSYIKMCDGGATLIDGWDIKWKQLQDEGYRVVEVNIRGTT